MVLYPVCPSDSPKLHPALFPCAFVERAIRESVFPIAVLFVLLPVTFIRGVFMLREVLARAVTEALEEVAIVGVVVG